MINHNRFFYEYIVITYAVGDFISFESFLTDKEKANLKEIICLSKGKCIPHFECVKKSKFYNKNCKITCIERPNGIDDFEIRNKLLINYLNKNPQIDKDKMLIDYNFYNENDQYKEILKNQNIKNYSFIKQKLCEINKFKLPQKYTSISAWSYNYKKNRAFDIEDWYETIKILKFNNTKGVVLNNQNWYLDNLWFKEILKEDCFINLIGETNYFEAIEIVKNSKGFIGIDSSLSIIATQALQEKSIIIKASEKSGAYIRTNYFYSNLKKKCCLTEKIKLNKFKFRTYSIF
jgi:ADP-heptose:LPS heptosyltransferase